MPSPSSKKANYAEVNRSASTHKQHCSSRVAEYCQSELVHHKGPYVANEVSSAEREAVIPAWLKEISRVFADVDIDAGVSAVLDDASDGFRSLGIHIGAHLAAGTFSLFECAQENIEVSAPSDNAHNDVEAPIIAEDVDNEAEVSFRASLSKP